MNESRKKEGRRDSGGTEEGREGEGKGCRE